jgi:hypothetical protein
VRDWLKFFLKLLGWLVGLPLAVTIVGGLVCKGPVGAWKELKEFPGFAGGILGGFAGAAAVIGGLSLAGYAIAIPIRRWLYPARTGTRAKFFDVMTLNQKRWSLRALAGSVAAFGVWSASWAEVGTLPNSLRIRRGPRVARESQSSKS